MVHRSPPGGPTETRDAQTPAPGAPPDPAQVVLAPAAGPAMSLLRLPALHPPPYASDPTPQERSPRPSSISNGKWTSTWGGRGPSLTLLGRSNGSFEGAPLRPRLPGVQRRQSGSPAPRLLHDPSVPTGSAAVEGGEKPTSGNAVTNRLDSSRLTAASTPCEITICAEEPYLG